MDLGLKAAARRKERQASPPGSGVLQPPLARSFRSMGLACVLACALLCAPPVAEAVPRAEHEGFVSVLPSQLSFTSRSGSRSIGGFYPFLYDAAQASGPPAIYRVRTVSGETEIQERAFIGGWGFGLREYSGSHYFVPETGNFINEELVRRRRRSGCDGPFGEWEPYFHFLGQVGDTILSETVLIGTRDQLVPCEELGNYLGNPIFVKDIDLRTTLSEPQGLEGSVVDPASGPGTDSTAYLAGSIPGWAPGAPVIAQITAQDVEFRAVFSAGCGGDYQIRYTWEIREGSATAAPEIVYEVESRRIRPDVLGQVVVEGSYRGEFNRWRKLLNVEIKARSCAACDLDPRADVVALGSVRWNVGLGRLSSLQTAGRLWIAEEDFSPRLFTPEALSYGNPDPDRIEVIRRAGDRSPLRQILTPQYLVDVVTHEEDDGVPDTGFEVRFFEAGAAVPGAEGLYEPSGLPLVSYRFEDASEDNPALRISRFTNGASSPSLVRLFSRDSQTGAWTLAEGGLRETTRSGGLRIERDGDGNVISMVEETWSALSFGGAAHQLLTGRKVFTEVDAGGHGVESSARVTAYSYYGMDGDGVPAGDPRYGRLKYRIGPDGDWEIYDYDGHGRLARTISQYRNNPFFLPVDENANRVATVEYGALGLGDEDITRVEFLLGVEVARSYEIHTRLAEGREVETINAAMPGAAWDAPANRVAIRTYDVEDRVVRSLRPDGILTVTHYTDLGDETSIVRMTGKPDPSGNNVIDGTRTEILENFAGQVIEERSYDIASNILLSFAAVPPGEVDYAGRPTRMDFLDGTSWTRFHSCCGLESETNREGITTYYTYDALGRRDSTTRNGITVEEVRGYNSGPEGGPTLSRIRRGSDGSAVTLSVETFDLAGRRLASRDATGHVTTHREVRLASGLIERTTTFADASTVVETRHPSGERVEVSGDAAYPVRFETGTVADSHDGLAFNATWSREIMPGLPGEPEAYVTTYRDMLRQVYKTVRTDSHNTEPSFEYRYFDQRGRLARTVDADGVTMLFTYNARGELRDQILDMNRNGVTDYGGEDRINLTETAVVLDSSRGAVRRTTTWVWAAKGVDAPEVIAVSDQSVDGRESWETIRGQTTHAHIAHDGQGGRTETTTAPEGVVTVAVFQDGRLQSRVATNPAGETLFAIDYTYDAHERVAMVTDARGQVTSFAYDANDRIRTMTEADPGGGEPWVTSYFYDERGREETVILPDGGARQRRYTPRGELLRSWGAREYPAEYAYDPQGRRISLTTWQDWDPAAGEGISGAATTAWVYDARGNLLEKRYDVRPDGAFTAGPSYAYSPADRLLQRQWARGVTTTYTYNNAGDLVRTAYSDGTPEVEIQYDRKGRTVRVTDAAGVRELAYDRGQTVRETLASPAFPSLDGYTLTRELDAFNRVTGLRLDHSSASETAYSSMRQYRHPVSNLETGRLSRISAQGLVHEYAYVSGSSLIEEITSESALGLARRELRSYDSQYRLSEIHTVTAGPDSFMFTYAYNRAGQRVRADREDGSYWEYEYDSFGQVVSGRKSGADGVPIPGHQLGYAFDSIGNRLQSTDGSAATAYASNGLNQMTGRQNPRQAEVRGAAHPDAMVHVNGQPADRNGVYFSALLSAPPGDEPVLLEVDIEARLPGAGAGGSDAVAAESGQVLIPPGNQAFAYDADGNLTGDGLWTYTWNGENRLVAMEQVATLQGQPRQRLAFTYDAMGHRVAKEVEHLIEGDWTLHATHAFHYDDWNLILEIIHTPRGETRRTYTWGPDLSGSLQGAGGVGGLLAVKLSSDDTVTLALPAFDGNGNVHAYTDAHTGQTLARFDYDPFGRQTLTSGDTQAFPHQFSTKYHDPATGLLYYGFRYYHPETGRWLNRDPIEEQGGLNLYAFVYNDPVNKWDYLGLESLIVGFYGAGQISNSTNRKMDEIARAVGADRMFRSLRIASAAAYIRNSYKDFGCKVRIFGFSWGGSSAVSTANRVDDLPGIVIEIVAVVDPHTGGRLRWSDSVSPEVNYFWNRYQTKGGGYLGRSFTTSGSTVSDQVDVNPDGKAITVIDGEVVTIDHGTILWAVENEFINAIKNN